MGPGRWRSLLAHPWVIVVAAIGLALRIWVLKTGHGQLSADEAVTGLGAVETLDGRIRIVIPGNAYTATLEAFLFAPFVAVFGTHVVPLKLLPVLLWAAAAVLVVPLARRVLTGISPWVAGAVVWLAPGALLIVSTRAYFGYAGGVLAVIAAFLALAVVADAERSSVRPALVAGFFAGLAFYIHPMYSAVVLPAAVVVTVRHRREVREWWVPAIAGALAANLPFLGWNLRNGWASLEQQNTVPGTYSGRFTGFFTDLLPRDFGVMNSVGNWIVPRPVGWLVWWGLPLLALFGAVVLARRSWAGRMFLAAVLACWPIMAAFAALGNVVDGRYGVILLPVFAVTLPAGGAEILRRVPRPRPVAVVVAIVFGALLLAPFQWRVITDDFLDPNAGTTALVQRLDDAGIDKLGGSYWVVLPVTYVTDARIRSAVPPTFPIRYPSYQAAVETAPPAEVAFAFQYDDINPNMLRFPIEQYERVDLPGVVLFLPPVEVSGAGS